MIDIEELISIAEKSEYDAKGGNKKCYIIGDYALLEGTIDEDKMKTLIEMSNALKEKGINVARTLDYKITDGTKGYSLQEKAVGTPLHNMVHWSVKKGKEDFETEKYSYNDRLTSLTQESQEFYNNFVQDWINIEKSGIMIDPSKPANFFYEKGKGITFIDLDNITEDAKDISMEITCYEMASALIASGKYFKFARDEDIKENAESSIAKIFGKFAKAMETVGMSMEDVKKVLNERFENFEIEVAEDNTGINPISITNSTLRVGTGKEEIGGTMSEIRNSQAKGLQHEQPKSFD